MEALTASTHPLNAGGRALHCNRNEWTRIKDGEHLLFIIKQQGPIGLNPIGNSELTFYIHLPVDTIKV